MPQLSNNTRAALAAVAAMGLFVTNDACIKLASRSIPVPEALALRGVFASLSLLAVLAARGMLADIRPALTPLMGLRGVIEFSGAFAFLSVLPFNSLANLTAIQQTAPLLMTAVAALLLRERIAAGRIIAILLGFAGSLMIAQPDAGGFSPGALAAFWTAAAICGRDLLARLYGGGIAPLALAFVTSFIVFVCTLLTALFFPGGLWSMPALLPLAAGACAGLLVGLAQLCIALAMQLGEVQAVVPFYYTLTPFSVVLSFLFFDDRPNGFALAGMALIVAAGVYVLATPKRHGHERRTADGATRL